MLTDFEYCEKLSEFLNINYPLEKASYLVSIGFCEKNLYFINIVSYEGQTNRILHPKTAKELLKEKDYNILNDTDSIILSLSEDIVTQVNKKEGLADMTIKRIVVKAISKKLTEYFSTNFSTIPIYCRNNLLFVMQKTNIDDKVKFYIEKYNLQKIGDTKRGRFTYDIYDVPDFLVVYGILKIDCDI